MADTKTKKTANKATEQAKAATERAQEMFGDVNERTQAAMEKSGELAREWGEFGKGNMEALVASARIAAEGTGEIAREASEFGRARFEAASATLKDIASAKSPTEAFQLQSEFAKSAFDSMIEESSKLSEAWLKLAGDVFEPLSSRYAVAADKLKEATA